MEFKSAASTLPESETLTVKVDAYLVKSNAFAPAIVPSYDSKTGVSPPPPQAASGRSRIGIRPFLFFFAAFTHFFKKASRELPPGTSTS